jgi:hypothetical protein
MLELLLLIVLLLIVALGIYLFISKNKKRTKKSTTEKPAAKVSVDPLEENISLLIGLNITVRIKNVPVQAQESIEKTIDALRELLPLILQNHDNTEMAWVMKRMCSHYLPKLINPFVALSNREAQMQTFLESLSGIDKELEEVALLLNSAQTSEFESKARFIKHRFN